MRNRNEVLEIGSGGEGARCHWRWTSDLHVAQVYPALGRALLRRALRDWPVRFAEGPCVSTGPAQVSFLIGHRGRPRLPLLQATLASLAAQEGVTCEYVVVEQAPVSELTGQLPGWVRLVHSPPPASELPYSRAWAFNVAARHATASLLVFHDGDILAPAAYARELLRVRAAGAEALDLKRFRFELAEGQNATALAGRPWEVQGPLVRVMQNLQGGTVAMDREAFFEIGGFDEGFVGWGGEDNEFWERATTRRAHSFGWLPFVHLWHPGQPEKAEPLAPAISRYQALSETPPALRIERLRDRRFGCLDGPQAP